MGGQSQRSPTTDKNSLDDENKEMAYGSCSMQGWRKSNEDAHINNLDIGDGNQLYAIFDGHGGENVAMFCEHYFTDILKNLDSYQWGNYELALQEAFVEIDYMLVSNEGHQLMRKVCKNNQSIKQIAFNEGCTACVVLIANDSIYCANAGDSRAIIGTKKGEVIELSHDHKPDDICEKRRIQAAGGNVSGGRVDGSLAVSRALGDWEFKNEALLDKLQQQTVIRQPIMKKNFPGQGEKYRNIDEAKNFKVSSYPEVIKVPLKDDYAFILNACDGIWDCYSNTEAVSKVFISMAKLLKKSKKNFKLSKIIEGLMNNALATDGFSAVGTDNMTCILAQFKEEEEKVIKKRPFRVTTDFEELNENLEQDDIKNAIPVLQTHMGHWKFYLRDCDAWNFKNVMGVFLNFIKKMPDFILERHQKDLFTALFYKGCYQSDLFQECLLGILKCDYAFKKNKNQTDFISMLEDDVEDEDFDVGLILAVAVYIENYGEENYNSKNRLLQVIHSKKNDNQEYIEAVARLLSAEDVFQSKKELTIEIDDDDLPEMDITQLFDEDWFEEVSNLEKDDEKLERIQILNEFIGSQKISDEGDFYAISEFIMNEIYSENPQIVKAIIKLTIFLKDMIDLTMFLQQMIKLISDSQYRADIIPFMQQFSRDKIEYNESIHEIMRSILNSQMSTGVKIQAILFINKYQIEENEAFYDEVKAMLQRAGKTEDQDMKMAVKLAMQVLKVEENARNKLQNRALFDWYVSYGEIAEVVLEEVKDAKDVEVLILGAPNPKMKGELDKEDEVKSVVSFGSSLLYISEEIEEPKQTFDLTICGFTNLTQSSEEELGMLQALFYKVVSVLKPTGKLAIISNSQSPDEEIEYLKQMAPQMIIDAHVIKLDAITQVIIQMMDKKGGAVSLNNFLKDPEMLKIMMAELARQQRIKAENVLFQSPETKALALLKRNKRMNEEEAAELKHHTKELQEWKLQGKEAKDYVKPKRQEELIMYVVKMPQ